MRPLKASLLALSLASSACLVACGSSDDAVVGDDDTGVEGDGGFDTKPKSDSGADAKDTTVDFDVATDSAVGDGGTDTTVADGGTDTTATDGGTDTTATDGGTDTTVADGGTDTRDAAATDTADAGADTTATDATDGGVDATDTASTDADVGTDVATDVADAAGDVTDGGTTLPDLWVVRVGATGSGTALSSTSAAVFIDKFSATGTLKGTITLPTAVSGSNKQFSLTGASGSEGYLNRSVDTHYVTLAGYAADVGTATVSSTTAAATPRVVARINAAEAIDTTTTLGAAYTGANVRSAVTVDGSAFWTGGNSSTAASSGVQYVLLGGTGLTQISGTPANGRVVSIYFDQLYLSSGSNPFDGISMVGTGRPTTTATVTLLPGFPSASTGGPSPYAFVAFDRDTTAGIDTIYVADDNTGTTPTAGVQRWHLVSGTWTKEATFADGTTAIAPRGLTGLITGSTVTLFATLADGRLVMLVDTGLTTATVTTLSTATTNTAYRGVAFAPL